MLKSWHLVAILMVLIFLYKTIFKGESCADTTIFDDKKGTRWLFTNKSKAREILCTWA